MKRFTWKALAGAVILFIIVLYFLRRPQLHWAITNFIPIGTSEDFDKKFQAVLLQNAQEYTKDELKYSQPEKKNVRKLSTELESPQPHSPLLTKNDRQLSRENNLRRACEVLRLNKSVPSDEAKVRKLLGKVTLSYSDSHKYLVCQIPKCGCSSVKKVLAVTENLVKEREPQAVRSGDAHKIVNEKLNLNTFKNFSEISSRLKSYKKLIIVRDPFYRLLSAYRNKMETFYPWSKSFAILSRKIHQFFGRSKDGKMATFEEFLTYVAQNYTRNRHWNLYNELCSPCMIDYDFIAHIETIEDDMQEFFEQVHLKNITFPHNYDKSKETDEAKFNRYFKNVSSIVADDIYKKFLVDFKLFQFDKPVRTPDP